VERIAKAHGAIVQVQSELGQGTTFGVYFPIGLAESLD
jgi:signal transduction histidine kinase